MADEMSTEAPEIGSAQTGSAFELPSFARGLTEEDLQTPESETVSKPMVSQEDVGAPMIVGGGDEGDLDIVPNSEDYTNKISVEDMIVSPRQKLCREPLADIRFNEVPVRDALRYLAEASGINYVLPDMETDNVTVNIRAVPFKAMETIANNFGLGIYEEGDLWFIRKKDKEKYFAKIYKLKNIHLGKSISGTGTDKTDNNNNDNNNNNNNNNSNNNSNDNNSDNNDSSSTETSGDVVMTTLEEILGIDADFGGTFDTSGTSRSSSTTTSSSSTSSSSSDNTYNTADYTYVSYDAEANTVFVIATATQHQWVEQYLTAIDNPVHNIAIEAMFLETSKDPSTLMGIDWEGSAGARTISMTGEVAGDSTSAAGDTIPLGTLRNPDFPMNGLIETSALSWSLSAFQKETDSQIARYPSVVTQNGRQVKIETTQEIPLSAVESVVSATTGDTTTVGVTDLGTQSIGTIITITPHQINEELVQLEISIEISTASDNTDSNTNRVATNTTTYDGVVNVPAGYTLAIGGLERIEETIANKKVPMLGNIPLFGFLFKSEGKSYTKANIFMFITPTILDADAPDNAFLHRSEGLSKDWIDRADAQHRAWRRNTIDPQEDAALKKANQK
jgi:type II secretory pathway component GspD/PulD (secretin)